MSQLIVSYYTQGAYAKEADRLRKSLDRLDLTYRLEEVAPFADWSEAVRYKPLFLARMRAIYSEVFDLLFVDADAVVWQNPWPELAEQISLNGIPDIGVHFLNTHPQSGTIFLPAKGRRTTELLHKWIAKDAEHPIPQQPQEVLRHLFAESDYSTLRKLSSHTLNIYKPVGSIASRNSLNQLLVSVGMIVFVKLKRLWHVDHRILYKRQPLRS